MLIRCPAAEVFEAFVDPTITTRFWFTKSSGRLEPDAEVVWTWEMYDVSTTVSVDVFEPARRIVLTWDEPHTQIEWIFRPGAGDTTMVQITETGFSGDGDAVVTQAMDSMGGFTIVLAAAKALLEHDLELSLVADHHPPGMET